MQQRSIPLDARAPHFDAELSDAIASGICVPLSALRASMESLARGLDARDPRATLLASALDEVVRMGRNVQALLDIALPPPLRPLDCTLEEIAHAALQSIGPDQRARVLLAVESGRARLFVDGPCLSTTLSHLIESGLCETSHPVLVSARSSGGGCMFSIVSVARTASQTTTRSSPRLGLELARRQIQRLGGDLSLHCTLHDQVMWLVHLPSVGAQEAA
jgi:K+-sensing histidine kinase KdpD